MNHAILIALLLASTAGSLEAQTASSRQKAANAITAKTVARHIAAIADDSMWGRGRVSRGLELTARYVADQFRKVDVKPAGDSGTWFQRYPVLPLWFDFARSRVVLAAGGTEAVAAFMSIARLGVQFLPEQLAPAGVVLLSGRHTAPSLQGADLAGKIVLYVAPASADSTARRQVFTPRALFSASSGVPRGIVILSNEDSVRFVERLRVAVHRPSVVRSGALPGFDGPWEVHLWPTEAVQAVLAAGGVDLARARADTTPRVRELRQLTMRSEIMSEAGMEMNTVGIIEGSDPKLKDEYIVFSAHMDHLGAGSGGQLSTLGPLPDGDQVYNGADDNASGVAGIIELAKAFSRSDVRPRRSLLFLGVGTEEGGGSGSAYFAEHPPVPLARIVANINLDMIGRNWQDSVSVAGMKYSDLGITLHQIAATHPELRIIPNDEGWAANSDNYHFAVRGIPILYFKDPAHNDYHKVTDSAEKIEADREARLLRLVFYLGQALGNADIRPRWNEEGYNEVVDPKLAIPKMPATP